VPEVQVRYLFLNGISARSIWGIAVISEMIRKLIRDALSFNEL